MKKLISLLIVALMATTSVLADDIDVQQALQIAGKFAKAPSTQRLSKRKAPAAEVMPELAYSVPSKVAMEKSNAYVVNLGNNQGFVIVSAESGTGDEILGYCDHGSFSYDDCPVQMKDLLNFYSESIDSLRQHPSMAAPRKVVTGWASYLGSIVVGPLLTTTWSQYAPYNNQCPPNTVTGCVPTAVAQVMNYWKWPKESIGTLVYYAGEHSVDFSGHVYDWDNMLDYYGYTSDTYGAWTGHISYNQEQADAVAKLMADIGKAFGTRYGQPNGSPTYFGTEPLVKNFSYEPDIQVKTAKSATELTGAMKIELDNHRPVLYAGKASAEDDGHALVVDGYTTNDYFHFNYGWGGLCDGFYKSALIKLYNKYAEIFTNVRPYDAVHKVIDDIDYALMKNGEAHIFDYTQKNVKNGVLEIPATVTGDDGNEYRVTRICSSAFYQKGHFNKMVIGENIEIVDAFSFFYTNIDTLVLSDKMEVVPVQAFLNTKVKNLTIGKNVKRIDKRAFYMCDLSEVTSKSPAFEVGEEAFAHCRPDCGEWLGCITKIGKRAFFNANFSENPYFARVEEIEDEAFIGARFPNNIWFKIPPTLKSISPTALSGAITPYGYVERFEVDENNPYFSGGGYCLFNKNKTSLVILAPAKQPGALMQLPETMVKLERGSIISRPHSTGNHYYDVLIPNTIIDMEGAFKNCETMDELTCLAITPPVISDSTFNDKIFENSPEATLYVPEGTEELYTHAPGWRRFKNIIGNKKYTPLDDQDHQYYMVVNSTGEGEQRRVNIPVNEVTSMSVSDDGQQVVIKRNGKDDLTMSVAALDSISWMTGFVYENAEVFDLNDSTLTVDAQKCSVTFDATAIDDDVQLCVRNLVLKPNVSDEVLRGFAVDLSLSDGTHELSGTAAITIPVNPGLYEKVCAAYYNEDEERWEPVFAQYDKLMQQVTITTDHLSTYTVYYVVDQTSNLATLNYYSIGENVRDLDEASKMLLNIVSSDDPDAQMVRQYKDDMATWQAAGLDGLYNAITSVSDPLLNFKPEAIDNAVTAMGYVGTALSILDVVGADLRGDKTSVAAGTLNTILNFASGQMASAIGTPIMSASMACVAFIGIALNKFGTMTQQRIHDLAYNAYHYYYSKSGKMNKDVNGKYRSPKDWFNYFYPAFSEGKMTKDKLDAYIEQSVNMYCYEIWKNYQAWAECCKIAKVWTPFATVPELTESLKEQLSNEHFAELMNGDLVSVFTAIKKRLATEANKRYISALEEMGKIVNTKIIVRFKDSSKESDKDSKYSGMSVRFTDAVSGICDPELFKGTIGKDGRGSLTITVYSLLENGIHPNITLVNCENRDLKEFPFDIPEGQDKVYVTIDLDKGGMDIDTQPLEGLELTYDPSVIAAPFWIGDVFDFEDANPYGEAYIYLNGFNINRARFQKEVERFFNHHNFIIVDESGNFKIGDDILGRFAENGLTATGKFTINVSNPFIEQTPQQYVTRFNKGKHIVERIPNDLLNGTIQHKIECEYTLTRASTDSEVFDVTYKGTGTYVFQAEVVSRVSGVDIDALLHDIQGQWAIEQTISVDNLTTSEITADGNVTLKYQTRLK